MYFQNYGLAKKGLDKYVKTFASHYPSTSSMVNTTTNYHGGTLIILIDNR